jgi:hypothetical protein
MIKRYDNAIFVSRYGSLVSQPQHQHRNFPMSVDTPASLLSSSTSPPRAVAIVLGHLGATSTQMKQYAAWYTSRQCLVIAAVSPPARFLFNWKLKPTACDILHQTWHEINDAEKHAGKVLPIVVHSMSNGGCFLLEQIEKILLQTYEDDSINTNDKSMVVSSSSSTKSSATTTNTSLTFQQLSLLSNRMQLGYQLFDSCPCFIRTFWWQGTGTASIGTLPWSDSFPHPLWSRTWRWWYTGGATLALSLWCATTWAFSCAFDFWYHMEQSKLCWHQIYLYTTTDVASDATALDRLIEYRRSQFFPQIKLSVHRWEDSAHCRLHTDHPAEYQLVIEQALDAAIERAEIVSKPSL